MVTRAVDHLTDLVIGGQSDAALRRVRHRARQRRGARGLPRGKL